MGIKELAALGFEGKPMVAHSALALILSGAAMLMVKTTRQSLRITAYASIFALGAIALANLAELGTGWNLGIDELLFRDPYNLPPLAPGRMAPNAAACFLLTAAALWLMRQPSELGVRRPWILGGLGFTVMMLGATALLGYLAGFQGFYGWWQLKTMPVPMALLLTLLGGAVLGCALVEAGVRWLLGRWLIGGFGLGLAVIIATAIYARQTTKELAEANAEVAHAIEFLPKIRLLAADLEIEHLSLQYDLLTDTVILRDRTTQALASSRRVWLELRAMDATHVDLLPQLNHTEQLINHYKAFIKQLIDERQSGGSANLTGPQLNARATELIHPIREQIDAIIVDKAEWLASRQATIARLSDRAASILPIEIMLMTLLTLAAVLRLNAEAATRLSELTLKQEIAEQLADQALARAQALDTLSKSEARLKTIFDESPMGIARINSHTGHIDEVNPRFAAIAGRSQAEMATINWMQITHPDDVQLDLANMAALNAKKINGFQMEKRYLKPDGTTVWINMTISPLRDEDTAQPHHLCMIEDITERKKLDQLRKDSEHELNEKRERLALATTHNGIGIWDYNPTNHKLVWDDSMFELYHIRRDDFIGTEQAWRASLHPDDLTRGDQELADAIAGIKPFNTVFRIVWPNGSIRYIKAIAKLFRDEQGAPVRMLGANWDVTALKESEAKIHMLNAELEQRVVERTAELNAANANILKLNADLNTRAAKLEAVNKELEAFSYSVSHDLRAPLRAIDGYARMAVEDFSALIDDNGRRLLKVIGDEAKRMSRLIDDLLAFSRLSRQQIEPMKINMRALAQEVFDELMKFEPARTVELTLADLPAARGTEAMIRQVWVNLISNALKFTRKRPVAQIEIGAQADANDCWTYHVKDNGAGFDMRYADKLFGVFQRLHNQPDFEGTGVGLALVQRILQRHGGRIWAESEIDQGARFYFTLPDPAAGAVEARKE
jgi:PAS domain S-box-containing protein